MEDLNLVSLMDRIHSDEKCLDVLEDLRWPVGVCCTWCGDTAVHPVTRGRGVWCCDGCDRQFTVTAGTVMHRSRLPLRVWFCAVYLMCQSKKGMSAHQLHRMLGTTYKTAWYLCHRIRQAMGNDPFTEPTLVGIVEIDETMIGGKKSGPRVNHAAEEWVVGDVHTNSVEGVWSLFKRSIVGSFHKMSVKHMDRYLEELEWRFNNRDNPQIFMDTLRRIVNTDPLEYRALVG